MFSSQTSAILKQGLNGRKVVSFEYDGTTRFVEVHAMGITKTGKECIRGYQVDGGSVSGDTSGWKLFSLNRIHDEPSILDVDALMPREGYTPGDSAFTSIEAQV